MSKIKKKVTKAVIIAKVSQSHKKIDAVKEGARNIKKLNKVWGNSSKQQLAGRIAEEIHATSFNVNSAAKFNNVTATSTASMGLQKDLADIVIKKSGKVVGRCQLKYNSSPSSSVFEISHSKYTGMQKIIPSEHLSVAKKISNKRGSDGLSIRNYQDTSKTLSDKIEFDGIKSKPLTQTQAAKIAKNPAAMKKMVNDQIKSELKNTALIGAGVGAATSIIASLSEGKSLKETSKEAAIDAAKSSAHGIAVHVTSTGVKKALAKMGAGSLARGAAPAAAAMAGLDIAKDAFKMCTGELSGEDFCKKAGGNVVKGGLTYGGVEVGAWIGTFILPGFGTFVGATAGGILGSMFGGWFV
jgi:hypothetical protein